MLHPHIHDTQMGDVRVSEIGTRQVGTTRTVDDAGAPPVAHDPLSDATARLDSTRPEDGPAFVERPARGPTESHMQDRPVHHPDAPPLVSHVPPQGVSDHVAFGFTKMLRFFADTFFAKRYGHRAVVLETVAGVPGMVGGMFQHLTSLRRMRDDEGWIRTLLDEAENERMHLMTFIEIAQPNGFERFLIIVVQVVFLLAYSLLYLVAPRTAHRVVAYFEEEAVFSYTQYLNEVDHGEHENVPAPRIAIDYWKLPEDARLRDVIIAVRADECAHRDVNHGFVDVLDERRGREPNEADVQDARPSRDAALFVPAE